MPPSVDRPTRPAEPGVGGGGPEHQYLQELVKHWAQAAGFHVTLEEPVLDGKGRVDVVLREGDRSIACEIAVTTSAEHEVKNVEKCLLAGFGEVLVVSRRRSLLGAVAAQLKNRLDGVEWKKIKFLLPEELWTRLDQEPKAATEGDTVAGYRVKVRMHGAKVEESEARARAITAVIARSVRGLRKDSD